ncbi:MAG: hypothetical protein V2A74_13635 [bacterium]
MTNRQTFFDPKTTYDVFVRKIPGGGKVVVLTEGLATGVSDQVYQVSSAAGIRKLSSYEIDSTGLVHEVTINRAQLSSYAYVGMMSGYGANLYHQEGKNLKQIVKDFGTLAKPKRKGIFGLLRSIFGF